MVVYFRSLSLIEFQGRYLGLFCLFSVIDGFEWLWMGSLDKNIQLTLEFFKAPFKAQGPILSLLYINGLPDYTIYNIIIYADDATLYFKCDQASDL